MQSALQMKEIAKTNIKQEKFYLRIIEDLMPLPLLLSFFNNKTCANCLQYNKDFLKKNHI